VETAGPETILAFVDGSLLQQRAEVFELTKVQFEVILQLQLWSQRSSWPVSRFSPQKLI
jgi:hypothetical protein